MAFTQFDQAKHDKFYTQLRDLVESVKSAATKEQREVAVQILLANPHVMEVLRKKRQDEDQKPAKNEPPNTIDRDIDILLNHLEQINIAK